MEAQEHIPLENYGPSSAAFKSLQIQLSVNFLAKNTETMFYFKILNLKPISTEITGVFIIIICEIISLFR